MTDQEIERIRTFLGSEYSVTKVDGSVVVDKVDIWDGVEFARCIESRTGVISGREIFEGQVYRITGWENEHVMLISGFEVGWEPKGIFTPASEDEYVEQLKKEAKERFGEIKDGDRFDRSEMEFGIGEVRLSFNEWDYCKKDDKLYFGTICIYKQGKWAKKIQQAIVTPLEIHSSEPDIVGDQVIFIQMKIIHGDISQKNRKDVAYPLAKCLEDYLNKS